MIYVFTFDNIHFLKVEIIIMPFNRLTRSCITIGIDTILWVNPACDPVVVVRVPASVWCPVCLFNVIGF